MRIKFLYRKHNGAALRGFVEPADPSDGGSTFAWPSQLKHRPCNRAGATVSDRLWDRRHERGLSCRHTVVTLGERLAPGCKCGGMIEYNTCRCD